MKKFITWYRDECPFVLSVTLFSLTITLFTILFFVSLALAPWLLIFYFLIPYAIAYRMYRKSSTV